MCLVDVCLNSNLPDIWIFSNDGDMHYIALYMDNFCMIVSELLAWSAVTEIVPVVYAEADDGISLNTQPRPLIELVFVTQGGFNLRVGGRELRIVTGDCAIINAHYGNFGTVGPIDKYDCISFDIKGAVQLGHVSQSPLLEVCSVADIQGVHGAYVRAGRVFHAPQHMLQQYRLKAEVLIVLAALLEGAQNRVSRRIGDTVDHVSRAVQFIQDNHRESDLSLAPIARDAHCSPAHLCRMFRARLGISPMEHLRNVRIRRAQDLLVRTDLDIKQIAAMTGYRDQLYFSRVFRSVAQVSPSAYRSRVRE